MKTWTKLFAGSAVLALTSGAFATAVPTVASAASKPTKITFWHAMTGTRHNQSMRLSQLPKVTTQR